MAEKFEELKYDEGDGKIVPEEITEEEKPEFVDMEESNLAREQKEKRREQELSLLERARAMGQDPVVRELLKQGLSIDPVFRVKYADERRENGEIFQEGMEEVGITEEKNPWEHKGDVVSTRQLYVIREGENKKGAFASFYLGIDKRDAEMARLIVSNEKGIAFAEGKRPDGKIKIPQGALDQLVAEHNMRVADDRRKMEEKRYKGGAADINFKP